MDTTFINGTTLTDADWFNDVNRLHYTILGDPADVAAVKTTLAIAAAAAQSDQETATSTATFVSPGRQQFHPSAAKGWVKANVSGSALASYNLTSVTDAGAGLLTVTWATDFSSANYCVNFSLEHNGVSMVRPIHDTQSAGAVRGVSYNDSASGADPLTWHCVAFGDQA